MGFVDILILFLLGFVTFFATGIDDTVAYAGSYLHNRRRDHKNLISLGILLGTSIALSIAIFAGSLLAAVPSRHLISGAVLVTLGVIILVHSNGLWHQKKTRFFKMEKRIKRSRSPGYKNIKFVGLGLVLFFATGLDDIIAYSNLIMAKGSWLPICVGIMVATLISLMLAHFLSEKLKRFPHPEKIGGVLIIAIGLLLAFGIL